MNPFFTGVTPAQAEEFIEENRRKAFLIACRSPSLWGSRADLHRRAANRIYDLASNAHEREMKRWVTEDHLSGARELQGEELEDARESALFAEYPLLIGYALECALKGILLMSRPDLVVDDSRLHTLVLTHDLVRLAREIKIDTTYEEQQALRVITEYVVWGKYPVPKELADMPSPVDPDDKASMRMRFPYQFHDPRARLLVDAVYSKVARAFIDARDVWREKDSVSRASDISPNSACDLTIAEADKV